MGCELESRELMALCLGKVSGIKRQANLKLIDASWIWTEPHSMRLKVRLTVQKEVQQGTILQQAFVVTFVVRNQQCLECQAEFRQGSWKSLVQVRQRVRHKRTFLYLEQLILKHGAHRGCLSVETFRDGMDFYFPDKGKAARFISFLENVVPIKVKTSKKLIGTDVKSNIANFKFTNLVEIVPVCKDDLVYLPQKLARNMGNISRLVLVKNITNLIHFVDPITGQTASMTSEVYWRDPLRPIITFARSRLSNFVVLGKEAVHVEENASKRSTARQRRRIASVTLAKESDLGVNDDQLDEISHIGYLLKAGDVCIGYELKDAQLVDDDAEKARSDEQLPDVVVIRKIYGSVATNENEVAKKRIFTLQRLDVDVTEALSARAAKKDKENDDMDEEDFLREVEADKEMRSRMNLYKSEYIVKKNKDDEVSGEGIDDDGGDDDESMDDQEVRLDELLDGLVLDRGPDAMDQNAEGNEDDGEMQYFVEGEKAAKDGIGFIAQSEARDIRTKDAAVPVGSKFGESFMAKEFKFI